MENYEVAKKIVDLLRDQSLRKKLEQKEIQEKVYGLTFEVVYLIKKIMVDSNEKLDFSYLTKLEKLKFPTKLNQFISFIHHTPERKLYEDLLIFSELISFL